MSRPSILPYQARSLKTSGMCTTATFERAVSFFFLAGNKAQWVCSMVDRHTAFPQLLSRPMSSTPPSMYLHLLTTLKWWVPCQTASHAYMTHSTADVYASARASHPSHGSIRFFLSTPPPPNFPPPYPSIFLRKGGGGRVCYCGCVLTYAARKIPQKNGKARRGGEGSANQTRI